MWEYVLGGATVFGLIVTFGAWINGRLTRGEISRLIVEEHRVTREMIREMIARMDEYFKAMDKYFKAVDEYFKASNRRFEELLKRMDERFGELVRQHNEILRRLAG